MRSFPRIKVLLAIAASGVSNVPLKEYSPVCHLENDRFREMRMARHRMGPACGPVPIKRAEFDRRRDSRKCFSWRCPDHHYATGGIPRTAQTSTGVGEARQR